MYSNQSAMSTVSLSDEEEGMFDFWMEGWVEQRTVELGMAKVNYDRESRKTRKRIGTKKEENKR